jgi:hypothetical protein
MSDLISYRIDNEGRFYRERLISQEIEVTEAVAKAFQQTQPLVTIPNVAVLNGLDVGVKYRPTEGTYYWSVDIKEIMLHTAFVKYGEGDEAILVPKFDYDNKDKNAVILSIPWKIVSDSEGFAPRVTLVVSVGSHPLRCLKQYLFAFDQRGVAWRLPMSNLYNTCELCSGEFDGCDNSQLGCVQKALDQFNRGVWNADLYIDSNETSSNFFRFKPLKDGFETLRINGKWEALCSKVSTPTTKYAI